MAYRILLVDDEADILEFIRYNLEKEDYEVFTAARRSRRRCASCLI